MSHRPPKPIVSMENEYFGPENYRYNEAFKPGPQLVGGMTFENTGQVMYNNLKENLMEEHVNEYTLHINSGERDTTRYRDPFKFTLTFNDPNHVPNISHTFTNVKYVKLIQVVTPSTNVVSSSGLSTTPSDLILNKYRYLYLRLGELGTSKILTTNGSNNDVIRLYPDKTIGTHSVVWFPNNGIMNYKDSRLENIKRIRFELLNNSFDPISMSGIDQNETDIDEYEHPCNQWTQMDIELVIGVVENEMATKTKYVK